MLNTSFPALRKAGMHTFTSQQALPGQRAITEVALALPGYWRIQVCWIQHFRVWRYHWRTSHRDNENSYWLFTQQLIQIQLYALDADTLTIQYSSILYAFCKRSFTSPTISKITLSKITSSAKLLLPTKTPMRIFELSVPRLPQKINPLSWDKDKIYSLFSILFL